MSDAEYSVRKLDDQKFDGSRWRVEMARKGPTQKNNDASSTKCYKCNEFGHISNNWCVRQSLSTTVSYFCRYAAQILTSQRSATSAIRRDIFSVTALLLAAHQAPPSLHQQPTLMISDHLRVATLTRTSLVMIVIVTSTDMRMFVAAAVALVLHVVHPALDLLEQIDLLPFASDTQNDVVNAIRDIFFCKTNFTGISAPCQFCTPMSDAELKHLEPELEENLDPEAFSSDSEDSDGLELEPEEDVDDGSESDSDSDSSCVQIGILEVPTHQDRLLRKYFPSKIGGKPAWLNPRDLPSTSVLCCESCSKPMRFLTQLYAPLRSMDNCFHRSLFLFVCEDSLCLSKPGSAVCVRTQLPLVNDFYSSAPPAELPELDEADVEHNLHLDDEPFDASPNLCRLCGIPASSKCSRCAHTYYCSRHHQAIDWRACHREECPKLSTSVPVEVSNLCRTNRLAYLWPQMEVIIDDEPPKPHADFTLLESNETSDTKESKHDEFKRERDALQRYNDELTEEDQCLCV